LLRQAVEEAARTTPSCSFHARAVRWSRSSRPWHESAARLRPRPAGCGRRGARARELAQLKLRARPTPNTAAASAASPGAVKRAGRCGAAPAKKALGGRPASGREPDLRRRKAACRRALVPRARHFAAARYG
jgi:hypothetical protein